MILYMTVHKELSVYSPLNSRNNLVRSRNYLHFKAEGPENSQLAEGYRASEGGSFFFFFFNLGSLPLKLSCTCIASVCRALTGETKEW